jgi:hypothetical protein
MKSFQRYVDGAITMLEICKRHDIMEHNCTKPEKETGRKPYIYVYRMD